MTEDILYTKDGALASLRFNRPAKKNAITVAMYAGMVEALDDAAADSSVRALGLFGGDDFTAGNDIGDFIAAGGFSEDMPVIAFLRAIERFPKPIVAGVKGVAIGIGTTMLMHCDAVVAGRGARFALPFTKLGLVPEAGSSVLLPLIAGRMRASWLLLSGEQFGAEDACDMGFVSRVADEADVDSAVAIMCGTLAELPPNAVATTKRLLKARFGDMVERAMEEEVQAFGAALQSDEARTALLKFMSRP
jgi:enoyl-CoA hydratase/carnithine racemase